MFSSHAYLVGDFLLLPIWLAAYIYRRDLYKEILVMSFLGGVLSVLFASPFLNDYWQPIYTLRFSPFGGIEDFLNGFFSIGIASVAYEELFAKRFSKRRLRGRSYAKYVLPALFIYALIFYLPLYLGLWSLYAAVLSFVVLLVIMLSLRHDLIRDAILSGLIVGALAFIGYGLFLYLYPDAIRYWTRSNLNNHLIKNIPAGELLWAFTLGATSGPIYEFVVGRRLISRAKRR